MVVERVKEAEREIDADPGHTMRPASAQEPDRGLPSIVEDAPASDNSLPIGVTAPVTKEVAGVAHAREVSYQDLLGNPAFRLLWVGQTISTFGSYFTRIAIPVYVFDTTGSYTQLGFAAFVSLLGSFVFGLVMGALADRWNRRRAMVGADLASACLLSLLILLIASAPGMRLIGLYLISFALAAIRELFNAARLAIFPEILSEEELLAANSLDQATATLAELASYPAAALALLWWGPTIAFGVDAASYLVSATLVAAMRVRPQRGVDRAHPPMLRSIRDGLGVAHQIPIIRRIVLLSLIVPWAITLLNTLQLPYAVDVLGSTKEIGFPALEGALAIGFSIGLLILGRWGQRRSRAFLLAGGIAGLGVCFMLLGGLPLALPSMARPDGPAHGPWTPLLLVALPLMTLAGAANSLIRAGIRTALQEQTPRDVLGRVGSIVSVAAGIGFSSGALLTGLAQGRVPRTLILIGTALLGFGLVSRGWLSAGQRSDRTAHP